MTTQANLTFREGENWQIEFTAHKADGTVLSLLSGGDIFFRVIGLDSGDVPVVLLELAIGDGVIISDAENGEATIQVTISQQETAGLSANILLYYEIEVVVAEVPSIQAEGRLSIERSLFATAVDPLLIEFQARFPEFTEDDSTISLYLREATLLLSTDNSWSVIDLPIATAYLAAHLLQMRKNASVTSSTGGLDVGAVKAITVEDRTVTFETGRATTTAPSSKVSLESTYYGQRFLSMQRRNPRFLQRA